MADSGDVKRLLIHHEKQEGELCAQHCLNALLQEEFYNPLDLANIAKQLDDEERSKLAEGGTNNADYRRFCETRSQNMDDSGFFSIQVLSRALEIVNLEMIPFDHPSMERFKKEPTAAKAYICNYRQHWFTIRKFGSYWINLNSMLSKPEPVSDTYLALYLAQLKNDGYSIFVITGNLRWSNADEYLSRNPLPPDYFSTRDRRTGGASGGSQPSDNIVRASSFELDSTNFEDLELQTAIENSMREAENRELERALRISLEQNTTKETK